MPGRSPSENVARALAAYDLGRVDAVRPLRGGRMAQSWRVSAAAGEFVLRRAEPDLPGRMPLAQRQRFQVHLAAHLPEVPRLIPNTRAQTRTEIDGARYELLAFIPGDTRDEAAGPVELPAGTLEAAARLLGRYHRAAAAFTGSSPPAGVNGGETPGSPGELLAARWERLRLRLAAESGAPQAGKPAPLPELSGAALERLDEWVQRLRAFWHAARRTPASDIEWLWAHGDFTPYNLVYRGDLPAGLIDFGAVQWMPAAYDVAIALLSFPSPTPDTSTLSPCHPVTPSSFLAAYEAERPTSAAERAALPMLALHRRAVAVLWIAEECLAGREELRAQIRRYLGNEAPAQG